MCCLAVPRGFLDRVVVQGSDGRRVRVRLVLSCDCRVLLDEVERRVWDLCACVGDVVELLLRRVDVNGLVFDVRFMKPLGRKTSLFMVCGNVDKLTGIGKVRDFIIDSIIDGVVDGTCVRVGDELPIVFASVESNVADRLASTFPGVYRVSIPETDILVNSVDYARIVVGNVEHVVKVLEVYIDRNVQGRSLSPFDVLVEDCAEASPHVVYRLDMPTLVNNTATLLYLIDHGVDFTWICMPREHGRTTLLVKTMLETLRRGGSTVALYFKCVDVGGVVPYGNIAHVLDRARGWKKQMLEQYLKIQTLEDAVKLCEKYDMVLLLDDFDVGVLKRGTVSSRVLNLLVNARCQVFAIVGSSSIVRHLYRGHVLELDGKLDIGDVRSLLRLLKFRDVDLVNDDLYRRLLSLSGHVPKRLVRLLRRTLEYCREANIDTSLISTVVRYVPEVLSRRAKA